MDQYRSELDKLKDGLGAIDGLVEAISQGPKIKANSISGDAILGGKISKFESEGVKDLADRTALTIRNEGIYTDAIHTPAIKGNVVLNGNLKVTGDVDIDLSDLENRVNDSVDAKIAELNIDYTQIPDRALSGNLIMGGIIRGFESAGIKDDAKRTKLVITDAGILTDAVKTKRIVSDDLQLPKTTVTEGLQVNKNVVVDENLFVAGEITATKIHTEELVADTRMERSSPLVFYPKENGSLTGSGLNWAGVGPTKQFIFRQESETFWSSENIDLYTDRAYKIEGIEVLSKKTLGSSVKESKLQSVGVLRNLRTTGSLSIDDFVFYNPVSNRFGIGVEEPSGSFAVASVYNNFIVDVEDPDMTKLGNFTAGKLDIITDNVARISIADAGNIVIGSDANTDTIVKGKLGINVTPDCDITSAGPIKFQNKKMASADAVPKTGHWNKGDIVWNDNPNPTGWVGWICTRTGNPGEWKQFGQISK